MSQQEAYNLLRRSKKRMTILEVAEKLDIGQSAASLNLQKLFRQGDIKRISIKSKQHRKLKYYF